MRFATTLITPLLPRGPQKQRGRARGAIGRWRASRPRQREASSAHFLAPHVPAPQLEPPAFFGGVVGGVAPFLAVPVAAGAAAAAFALPEWRSRRQPSCPAP